TGDADDFAALDVQGEVLEEHPVAVAGGEVAELEDHRAGTFARREVEVHHARPLLGPLQPVEPLEPLLSSRRLLGPLARAVPADVLRLLVDVRRLVVVLAPRRLDPLVAELAGPRVRRRVAPELARLDLPGLRRQPVQE